MVSSLRWSQNVWLPGSWALSLPRFLQSQGIICHCGRDLTEDPLADKRLNTDGPTSWEQENLGAHSPHRVHFLRAGGLGLPPPPGRQQ